MNNQKKTDKNPREEKEEKYSKNIVPKSSTQSLNFIKKYKLDGSGILIAIIDSGIDPGSQGLQKTSSSNENGGTNGKSKRKVINYLDATESGKIDTSRKINVIEGEGRLYIVSPYSEKEYEVRKEMKGMKFVHIGLMNLYEIIPKELENRLKREKKEKFDKKCYEEFEKMTNGNKSLKDHFNYLWDNYEDLGTFCDVIVYKDVKKDIWRVVVALFDSKKKKLSEFDNLAKYTEEFQYGTISKDDLFNYTVDISDDGNTVNIISPNNGHGTHVANILAGYYENDHSLNGVAPGAQIISIKIADSRLEVDGMETGSSIVKALLLAKKYGATVINYSFGEPVHTCSEGMFHEIVHKLVHEDNMFVFCSGGNKGPCLSTHSSPGSIYDEVFGIGAYLNKEMMKVQYCLSESDVIDKDKVGSEEIKCDEDVSGSDTMQMWSSCGPTIDGHLGISFVTPGSAITGIPNYSLNKLSLKCGTSMSSPNAAGNIVLLLSALKSMNRKWNVPYIKRMVQATCKMIPDEHNLSQGSGLIQICDAFEICKKYPFKENIHYDIKVVDESRKSTRGIYLRNFNQEMNFSVNVQPIFHPSLENDFKIGFEKRFNLKLLYPDDSKWIDYTKFLILTNEKVPFQVNLYPSGLNHGLYYNEILAFEKDNEVVPAFKVIVTAIVPIVVNDNTFKYETTLTSEKRQNRTFLLVPEHASFCKVSVKAKKKVVNNNNSQRVVRIHTLQLIDKIKFSETMSKNIFKITNDEEDLSFNMDVFPLQTLEIMAIQSWKRPGTITLEFTVEFNCNKLTSDILVLDDLIQGFMICSKMKECEKINLSANLLKVKRKIFPSKYKIIPRNETVNPYNGKVLYELFLTYKLRFFYDVKNVSIYLPFISDILYESTLLSAMCFVFDSNKRLLKVLDFESKKLQTNFSKGDYHVHVKISHFSNDFLEKNFKNIHIIVEKPLKSSLKLDIYETFNDAIKNSKNTISKLVMRKNDMKKLFIFVPYKKMQKASRVLIGDICIGELSFNSHQKVLIKYLVVKGKQVYKSNEKKKDTPKLKEFLKKKTIEYFSEHLKNCKDEFNEFLDVNKEDIDGLRLQLRLFKKDFNKRIEICNKIISLIDREKIITTYFDKMSNVDDDIRNAKNHLIFAVYKKTKYLIQNYNDRTIIIDIKTKDDQDNNDKDQDQLDEEEDKDNIKKEIENSLEELKKWTHRNETKHFKYLILEIQYHFFITNNIGKCLKLFKPKFYLKNEKNYLLHIKILQKLKWDFWVDYFRSLKFAIFPSKFKKIY